MKNSTIAAAIMLVLCAFLVLLTSVIVLVVVPGYHGNTVTVAKGKHGVVAADAGVCSEMGRDVLKEDGGNAVDAAIVTALCLGIVHPHSSGIGGGGAVIVRTSDGTIKMWDGREEAPGAASRDMYLNEPAGASTRGALAIGIPGEVSLMEKMHSSLGRNSWGSLFDRPVQMCEQGFIVDKALAAALAEIEKVIDQYPVLRDTYTVNGRLAREGEIIKRPVFAKTLQTIATEGASSFYNGSIASALISDLNEHPASILTVADFAQYEAIERKPVCSRFLGDLVCSAGAPFSGAVLILSLNILERYPLESWGRDSGVANHMIIESFKQAYADRLALGDPEFVPTAIPAQELMISKAHAAFLRQRLKLDKTFSVPYYEDIVNITEPPRIHGTTHLSVIDNEGNSVAFTTTVNLHFGSRVQSKTTGVLLNDEMDDFSSPGERNFFGFPPSVANYIAPYKRMMSSMTPAIVERDGGLYLSLGASGGSRIITSVAQVLLKVVAFNDNVGQAVETARYHDQLVPPRVDCERAIPGALIEYLRLLGHNVTVKSGVWTSAVVQAALKDGDTLSAASDWRKSLEESFSAAY